MTIKTFTSSGALLDTIAQAIYDNPHGLVPDDADTDEIARVFQNPRFISEVYSWLSDLHPDVIADGDTDTDEAPLDADAAAELLDAEFSGAINSFAALFGVSIDDYSLNLSSHRPPYIEFSARGFEGTVGISTWREYVSSEYAGRFGNKTIPTAPTKQELGAWASEHADFGNIIATAYSAALQKDKLKPTVAFGRALFAALDSATK